jgi:tol-pal system protein YbgF
MKQTLNRLQILRRTTSALAAAAAIAFTAPLSQAQVLGGAPYAPGPDPVMERLQSRVDALESQVRSTTGQMESLAFQLTEARRAAEDAKAGKSAAEQQIAALMARINSLERFARGETPTLEAAPAPYSSAPYSSVTPPPQGLAPAPFPGQADMRPTTFPASPGGIAPVSPAGPSPAADSGLQSAPVPLTPGSQAAVVTTPLPAGGDETAKMASARNLLLNGEFPAAQRSFTAFLDQHPKSDQAPTAQYLLAESLLYQEAYSEAAGAYGKVLSAYPKSEHGPESLVKLARSMRLMGKKSEACKALGLLPTNYPKAPATVKSLASAEKSRAGC